MNFNHHLLVATVLSLAAGTTVAQEASYDYPVRFDASVSRTQVKAEAAAAVASGEARIGEGSPMQALPSGYAKTRGEVNAEVLEARRLGLIYAGEGSQRQATEDELDAIRLAGLRARVQQGLIALLK